MARRTGVQQRPHRGVLCDAERSADGSDADVLRGAAASGSRRRWRSPQVGAYPGRPRSGCWLPGGRPRGAAGAQCGGPRGARGGAASGGEVGARGAGEPARPLPGGPAGARAQQAAAAAAAAAPWGECAGEARRGDCHCPAATPGRGAPWMALGVSAGIPPDTCGRTRTDREDDCCLE